MKKYIGIIFMILLFAGCKTKQQQVLKSDYSLVDKTQSHVTQETSHITTSTYDITTQVESAVNRLLELHLKQNTNVSATTYDTDKPIIPETGKPPVKSEITTKTSTEYSKMEQEYQQIVERQQILIQELNSLKNIVKDLSDYNVVVKSKLESKESSETTTGRNIALVCVIAVLLTIAICIWRLRKLK